MPRRVPATGQVRAELCKPRQIQDPTQAEREGVRGTRSGREHGRVAAFTSSEHPAHGQRGCQGSAHTTQPQGSVCSALPCST